jgi:hypothetical protein
MFEDLLQQSISNLAGASGSSAALREGLSREEVERIVAR